jgi:hypothetical protein
MSQKFKKLVFAVDFDGTVVFHKFPQIGAPVPGAIETLQYIQQQGGKIILHTMRSDQPGKNYLTDAVEWFKNNGIELYAANINPDQLKWTSSPKVYAHHYIDDAALGAPLMYNPDLCEREFIDWRTVRQLLDLIPGEPETLHAPASM